MDTILLKYILTVARSRVSFSYTVKELYVSFFIQRNTLSRLQRRTWYVEVKNFFCYT